MWIKSSLPINQHSWTLPKSFKDFCIMENYYYASHIIEMHGITWWVTLCYQQNQKIIPLKYSIFISELACCQLNSPVVSKDVYQLRRGFPKPLSFKQPYTVPVCHSQYQRKNNRNNLVLHLKIRLWPDHILVFWMKLPFHIQIKAILGNLGQ